MATPQKAAAITATAESGVAMRRNLPLCGRWKGACISLVLLVLLAHVALVSSVLWNHRALILTYKMKQPRLEDLYMELTRE